jgi:hypothetical protein
MPVCEYVLFFITGANSYEDTTDEPSTHGVMGVHNCSTAFFSQCMSIAKCKTSCKSMGAAKYRWFHEHGCCQCIGSTCIDYGLNEPHCLRCPLKDSVEKEDYEDSDEDYDGEKEYAEKMAAWEEESVKPLGGIAPDTV